MSVEFRQRKPSEYLRIVWQRKWLIILPTIAIATAVAWVVYRLPDVYESSTLIVVTPSTLPTSVVPTVTEDTITRQLSGITQVVTSRSSLEPLIDNRWSGKKHAAHQYVQHRGATSAGVTWCNEQRRTRLPLLGAPAVTSRRRRTTHTPGKTLPSGARAVPHSPRVGGAAGTERTLMPS